MAQISGPNASGMFRFSSSSLRILLRVVIRLYLMTGDQRLIARQLRFGVVHSLAFSVVL